MYVPRTTALLLANAVPSRGTLVVTTTGRLGESQRTAQRDRMRARDPLCGECRRIGVVRAWEELDHILPLHMGGTNDDTNMQGLCVPHHREKTRRDATLYPTHHPHDLARAARGVNDVIEGACTPVTREKGAGGAQGGGYASIQNPGSPNTPHQPGESFFSGRLLRKTVGVTS